VLDTLRGYPLYDSLAAPDATPHDVIC
jgi:hypothetical protein